MDLLENFNSTYQKANTCFGLLEIFLKHSMVYKYIAGFDYDAISHQFFLDRLLQFVDDKSIHVVYVDLTNVSVQKSIFFNKARLLSSYEMSKLQHDHAILHDCKVEGSYFLHGDSAAWILFYDAQSGFGCLLSDESMVINYLSEYVVVAST